MKIRILNSQWQPLEVDIETIKKKVLNGIPSTYKDERWREFLTKKEYENNALYTTNFGYFFIQYNLRVLRCCNRKLMSDCIKCLYEIDWVIWCWGDVDDDELALLLAAWWCGSISGCRERPCRRTMLMISLLRRA